MKVSSRSRYALLTVLDLAMHCDAGVSRVHDIARRHSIPQKFLEQILLVLKSGGLVTSRRGAKGGYLLAKAPAEISVADVLKLTEDALLSEDSSTPEGASQVFADIWSDLNGHILSELRAVTFDEIISRAEKALVSELWQYSI